MLLISQVISTGFGNLIHLCFTCVTTCVNSLIFTSLGQYVDFPSLLHTFGLSERFLFIKIITS